MKILILLTCIFTTMTIQAESLTLDSSIVKTETIINYEAVSHEIDLKSKTINIFYEGHGSEGKVLVSSILVVDGSDYDMVMNEATSSTLGVELQKMLYNCIRDKLAVTGIVE